MSMSVTKSPPFVFIASFRSSAVIEKTLNFCIFLLSWISVTWYPLSLKTSGCLSYFIATFLTATADKDLSLPTESSPRSPMSVTSYLSASLATLYDISIISRTSWVFFSLRRSLYTLFISSLCDISWSSPSSPLTCDSIAVSALRNPWKSPWKNKSHHRCNFLKKLLIA